MAANNIYIQVDLNSQTAQQNVNALNQAIANTGTEAEKSSVKGSKALTGLQLNINQTTKAFGELGTALAGLGIARVMEQIVQQSAQFSRAQTAITAFAGSAADAAKVIGQVRAIAAQSPFHFADLQESARQLLAFGIAAKDVPIHLKAITDQITAMGGTMEDVSGIVRIYGRIMEKDMVSAMDLIRKLPVEGVPVMKAFRDELSKALGTPVSDKDVMDVMKKGLLDSTQTLRILTEAMGKTKVPVNDAAAAFKNLGDEIKLALFGPEGLFGPKGFGPAFTQLAHDIGLVLLPLEKFIDLLKSLPEPAKEWIVRLAALGVGVTALAGGVAIATTVFGPLVAAIGGFIALLPEILTVMGALAGIGAILYKTVPGVRQWADNIKSDIDGLKAKAGEMQKKFGEAMDPSTLAKGSPFGADKVKDELDKLLEETQKTADAGRRALLEGLSSPVAAVELKYKDLFVKLEEQLRLLGGPEADKQKQAIRDALSGGESAELAGARFKEQKQAIDELAKYQTEKVKGSYDAQIAYIEALDEQGVRKRVAAIDRITELRIASAETVARVEDDRLQQIYDAQVAILEDLKKHGVDIGDAEATLYAEMTAKRKVIDEKAFDESQKYRLEGWKKANDVIIEDQKRVFDNFKSGFDQLFDILTGKSKDMGKAISDFFKKELLGEARNIFSTGLAQVATQAAGYGRPEADIRRTGGIFSSIFLRGTPPRPPGAPPDIFNPARGESTLKDYQGEFSSSGQGTANRMMASADVYSNSTVVFAKAVQEFAGAAGTSSQGYAERRMADDSGPTAAETAMLGTIGGRESRNNYAAYPPRPTPDNPHPTASGRYQIIDDTWRLATRNTGIGSQYAHARDAPRDVQDANALWLLRTYGPNASITWKASGPYATGGGGAGGADLAPYSVSGPPSIAPSMTTAANAPTVNYGWETGGFGQGTVAGVPGGFSLPTSWAIPNIAPPGAGPVTASNLKNLVAWAQKLRGNFGIGTAHQVIGPPGPGGAMGGTYGTTFGSVMNSPAAKAGAGMVGSMLFQAGVFGNAQGTALGLGESTFGGAGIGFSMGGPLGAAIGAAAGFGIGLGEMLAGVESPRNKAKRLASQLYHININNATADSIAALAQQNFGGNVGIAMRSPQVRQMLGLYAAGTGQANQFNMGVGTAHGASLVESGGTLSQQATYEYGNPYSYGSNLPVYGGQPTHILGAPGGGVTLSLNIDGSSAAKFLQGNVVSPDVVQTQFNTAMQNSNGRVSQALMMTAPGSIAG